MLIRVHAAGLNVGDGFIMRGVPYIIRLFAGLRRPRNAVRGADVAGTVSDVGANVTDLHPGEEVFGCCGDLIIGGAFATRRRTPGARPATRGRAPPEPSHSSTRGHPVVPSR